MIGYADARVIVEFIDGETRTYEPVGGSMDSPLLTGSGGIAVTLEMCHQSGAGATQTHIANVPLCNIRSYRLEPM